MPVLPKRPKTPRKMQLSAAQYLTYLEEIYASFCFDSSPYPPIFMPPNP